MKDSTGVSAGAAEPSESGRVVDLEHEVATLGAALAANRVSGTAVGLLMAQHRLTRDEAFALLVTQSQHSNTKVASLALEVVLAADAEAAARRRS